MAKAEFAKKGNVHLTMTEEQAVSLRSLIGWCVGGTPKGTYREDVQALYHALGGIDLPSEPHRFVGSVEGVERI